MLPPRLIPGYAYRRRSSVNFRGRARYFCPKNSLCTKKYQIARILHDFCPKMSEFFIIIARKKCFFPNFRGLRLWSPVTFLSCKFNPPSVVDCSGEDLVPEQADQVEEAEPRSGHQLPDRQSSISSLHRLICIRPALHGCCCRRAALRTNRTSSVPKWIKILRTVFSVARPVLRRSWY